jgi:hypothetical protein
VWATTSVVKYTAHYYYYYYYYYVPSMPAHVLRRAVCVAAIHGAHLAAAEVGGLPARVQERRPRRALGCAGGNPQVSATCTIPYFFILSARLLCTIWRHQVHVSVYLSKSMHKFSWNFVRTSFVWKSSHRLTSFSYFNTVLDTKCKVRGGECVDLRERKREQEAES